MPFDMPYMQPDVPITSAAAYYGTYTMLDSRLKRTWDYLTTDDDPIWLQQQEGEECVQPQCKAVGHGQEKRDLQNSL